MFISEISVLYRALTTANTWSKNVKTCQVINLSGFKQIFSKTIAINVDIWRKWNPIFEITICVVCLSESLPTTVQILFCTFVMGDETDNDGFVVIHHSSMNI